MSLCSFIWPCKTHLVINRGPALLSSDMLWLLSLFHCVHLSPQYLSLCLYPLSFVSPAYIICRLLSPVSIVSTSVSSIQWSKPTLWHHLLLYCKRVSSSLHKRKQSFFVLLHYVYICHVLFYGCEKTLTVSCPLWGTVLLLSLPVKQASSNLTDTCHWSQWYQVILIIYQNKCELMTD